MSYGVQKLGVDTQTNRQTDAGNNNIWRPKLASGNKRIVTWNKANLRDLIAATGLVISNWIQNVDFSALVTLKFDRWHRKTTGHFLYTTSSLVHHFKSIGEFGTARKRSIRVKIGYILSRVTLKFDGWPWKTIGHLFYTTSSFVHHFKSIGEVKLESQSGNAQFGSKSAIFCPMLSWNLQMTLKTIGHLFYAAWSFLHHFIAIGEFKLELQSGNG